MLFVKGKIDEIAGQFICCHLLVKIKAKVFIIILDFEYLCQHTCSCIMFKEFFKSKI